jgi:TolB-like protein
VLPWIALVFAVSAQAEPACKAAVLDLQAQGGISKERAQVLTDVIASAVRGPLQCTVLSRTDIRALVSFEEEKQLAGCDKESCIAEIGDALGVDRLVIGSIARIDERVVISLRLVDMHEMRVLESVTDSYIGPDAGAVPFTQWLARRLVVGDDEAGPRPNVDSRLVVEKQMTIWRVLSFTGIGLAGLAGVVSLGAGVSTWGIEQALPQQKTARGANRKQIEDLEALGPVLAGTSNIALYACGVLAIAGGALFFAPSEELVEVNAPESSP